MNKRATLHAARMRLRNAPRILASIQADPDRNRRQRRGKEFWSQFTQDYQALKKRYPLIEETNDALQTAFWTEAARDGIKF